jgi:uracil-DNA glycosylase family 4
MTDLSARHALQALYARMQGDPAYRSAQMGATFVPGEGTVSAQVVFIGEAPGQDEERQGRPFVGAAGRNLNDLLASIALSRDEVFITNLIHYRPFDALGKNRKPTPAESRRALPYLREELTLLAPQLIVCLGLAPATALLARPLTMREANGQLFHDHDWTVMVSYHPSPYNYLQPPLKAIMYETFQRLRKVLETGEG